METIVLMSNQHETDREFTITHAQKIMNAQKKDKVPGWRLTDKNFTLKDGVITYRNTAGNKKSEGKGSTRKGSKT